MTEEVDQVCSKCSHVIAVSHPPRIGDIFSVNNGNHSIDVYTHAACPNCGHKEIRRDIKFFGILGPRALRALVCFFILIMIIFISHDIWLSLK